MKLTYYEEITMKKIDSDLPFFFNSSIQDLSKKYSISDASIVRLFKKLGYNSLKSMQMDFYNKFQINEMTKFDKIPEVDKTLKTVINEITAYSLSSILKSQELINKELFDLVANEIINSKKITTFGVGNSWISAKYFSMQLRRLALISHCEQQVSEILPRIPFMTKDDIVIIFSNSLQTVEVKKLIDHLKDKDIKILLITSSNNKIENIKYNWRLNYKKHINENQLFPSISSNTGQLYIANILFNLIINKIDNSTLRIKRGNSILKTYNT